MAGRLSSRWPLWAMLLALPLLSCVAASRSHSGKPSHAAREAAEFAPYDEPGTGVISGVGFASPRGGGHRTLASRTVVLRPRTSWSRWWWEHVVVEGGTPRTPDALTAAHMRTVTADSTGVFRFEGLPPGSYYVVSSIIGVLRADFRTDTLFSGAGAGATGVELVRMGREVTIGPGENAFVTLDSLRRDVVYGRQALDVDFASPYGPSSW